MTVKQALQIFKKGFDDSLNSYQIKKYCDMVTNGLYLLLWYQQKYGKYSDEVVKKMVEEAKEIEGIN